MLLASSNLYLLKQVKNNRETLHELAKKTQKYLDKILDLNN